MFDIEALDAELAKLVEPVEKLKAEAVGKLAEAERTVSDLKAAIKRCDKALADLTGESTKPKPKQRRHGASEEVIEEVRVYLASANGNHTAPEIGEAIGRNHQSVRRAIEVLRDRELVRKSTPRDREVGGGRKADTFTLMNGT